MSHTITLELTEEIYSALQEQADKLGLSVTDLITQQLQSNLSILHPCTKAEKEAARQRFQRHLGSITPGYATGIDNESIDADLAKAYSDDWS